MRRWIIIAWLLLAAVVARAGDVAPPRTSLDAGYAAMYDLRFDAAHQAFHAWEQQHPEDPLGPASDAAAYLFSEFERLNVLQSELFTDNERYVERRPAPNSQLKQAFDAQLARAGLLADNALRRDPRDPNALFAGVLLRGLKGDYLALIERKDMQGLRYMKEGRALAEQLLNADPTYYDAYLAVGVENYLLSLKSAPVRWLLRVGGAQTDKQLGIEKLRITADKGHYLLPYARLLLAVAALRDHDRARARALLEDLARSFPHNHLYTTELAKLQTSE